MKVAVLLANGFETLEGLTVVDILRRAEVECNTFALEGNEVSTSHKIKVKADKNIMDEEIKDYDVIVLPGGMPGSTNLRDNESVIELVKEFNSKATTRARKVSTIRIFFKYLCQHAKLIDKNPALYLETPKLEKRLPKYLSLDDSKKLLNATYNEDNRNYARDYAIITLFLNCGIRLSELVGININDIDFSENKLNVIGKGNKERTIYLNKACMNALSEYLSVRPKQGIKHDKKNSEKALFLSERKTRIGNRTVERGSRSTGWGVPEVQTNN